MGRARYLAVATWRGGRVVREAKALVPSAWDWAHGKTTGPLRFLDLAGGRFRSPDPFMTVAEKFVFRRIAADSRKIDLTNGTDPKLPVQMLRAMGAEIGSVHAATGDADAIFGDLAARFDAAGLASAARKAAASVEADYVAWTA